MKVGKCMSVPAFGPGAPVKPLSLVGVQKTKAHSAVTPIEYTPVDPLSSSSSSDTMDPALG